MPPKAPANRTQYLSCLKKHFEDSTTTNKFEYQQQKLSSLNNNTINNHDQKTDKTTIQQKVRLARKTSFSELYTNNQTNAFNSSSHYANKENLPKSDAFTRRNSNYLALSIDFGNFYAADTEKSDIFNFCPEDEFLTGSTMKSIVESITKSKNKILSNSLNLDENESNLSFSPQENIPSHTNFAKKIKEKKAEAEAETETTEKIKNMNFKISDFIPDLQLDLDTNFHFTNENLLEQHQQNEFFHWQILNKLDSNLAENSTKEASGDNTPNEARSPLTIKPFSENEHFGMLSPVEGNSDSDKEKFHFFLLGNKKNRSSISFEEQDDENNKDQAKKKFFYDIKNS